MKLYFFHVKKQFIRNKCFFIRKCIGGIQNKNFLLALIAPLSLLVFVYLLLHWGFVCSNVQPKRHVKALCKQYRTNAVVGDLCSSLCVSGNISSFSCQTFHDGKEAVFYAVKNEHYKLVFKLARQVEQLSPVHWMEHGTLRFPSEDEFTRMIIDHVSVRLNTSISWKQAVLLGAPVEPQPRHQQMQERWNLLQDNEYLLATLYADREVFPRVLGSCGQYFALEYLQPAIQQYVTEQSSWLARCNTALLILDLLQEIGNIDQGFSLCDVKPSHFGLSTSSGKIKFLDLDVVLPQAIVNAITGDGNVCHADTDCNLFDCRSHCNTETHHCDSPQTNNNLQIVCEKIFLGWSVSGGWIQPGLLTAPQTPPYLAALLQQCAGSDGEYRADPKPLAEQLVATLQDLIKSQQSAYHAI